MKPINRRQALALLTALPFAATVGAQTRLGPKHRVILGTTHGFLLEPGGTLQAWHFAARPDGLALDALGLGHNRPRAEYTLAPVPNLKNVVAAAAGYDCSFAVLADGRLLSWGSNAGNGLLGTTPLSVVEEIASWGPSSNTPVSPVTKFDAVDVSSQESHVLALSRDGSIYAWGKGDKGQLGIGPLPIINFKHNPPDAMTYVPFPVRISTLAAVTAISAGRTHSLSLLKDGTLRAWGENRVGQLGDGTTTNRDSPVQVQGVRSAVAIAASAADASAALLADGTVMTWGGNADGQLGRPPWDVDRRTASPIPGPVTGVRGIRAIAAGLYHMIALAETGTVFSWGDATYGTLGRPAGRTKSPAVVPSLTGVQSIVAHDSTNVAMLANGRIMTWGAVRPWTRPGGGRDHISPSPILLWLDGLDQP
jgi:alpha-tubulin suppressor-like RCC1 family protein